MIDDELLHRIALVGSPADVGKRLRDRARFADRVSVVASYPVPNEWWGELAASFRATA